MRTLRYVVADVFTDTPLTGNQLAVFTDARDLDEATMQALALEVGFSETVFVFPPESGGTVRIRIFTPYFELPFAGHPTLGTAFVLGAPLQLEVIVLETGRGHVPVALERDESGRIVFGRMEQPVPSVSPFTATDELFAALGVEGSELPAELYDNGATFVFVARSLRGRAGGAAAEHGGGLGPRLHRRRPASRARERRGRHGCSGPGARTRPQAPQRGPSRVTSPATAASPGATRSRSRRAPRSAVRRRSTRAPTAAKG